MSILNRQILLQTMIKHETLIIDDLQKAENLGVVPNNEHLQFLLTELIESHHLQTLDGVVPRTYTITEKGIEEGKRLQNLG